MLLTVYENRDVIALETNLTVKMSFLFHYSALRPWIRAHVQYSNSVWTVF